MEIKFTVEQSAETASGKNRDENSRAADKKDNLIPEREAAEHSYYYDDSTGYEIYNPDNEEVDEDED